MTTIGQNEFIEHNGELTGWGEVGIERVQRSRAARDPINYDAIQDKTSGHREYVSATGPRDCVA